MLRLGATCLVVCLLAALANGYIISSPNGKCDCELETDYLGNDLTQFGYSPVTLEECCSYCQLTSNCQSFTQIPQFSQCWPKFSSEGRLRVLNSPGRISCKKLANTALTTSTTTVTTPTTTLPTTTTTTTTTTTAKPATCLFTENARNYPGNDIAPYVIVKSLDECCNLCKTTNGCNGFSVATVYPVGGGTPTYFCYLKSQMTNGYYDPAFASGFPSADAAVCKTAPSKAKASCTSYFVCTKDATNAIKGVLTQCPPGLQFSEKLQTCDFPANVNCVA